MVSQNSSGTDVAIHDAATVILVRNAAENPSVLMGQRGKTAAFMPEKFVFPGGRVDRDDGQITLASTPEPICMTRLAAHSSNSAPETIATAAIREVWEETGLRLARRQSWTAPEKWAAFADGDHAPDASALRFFFRAVTPPGRPRRFDARFFLADAANLLGDPDDFSAAEDELSHLHWVSLKSVRDLDLPYITQIVLAELEAHLPRLDAPDRVPFVRNDTVDSHVIWL